MKSEYDTLYILLCNLETIMISLNFLVSSDVELDSASMQNSISSKFNQFWEGLERLTSAMLDFTDLYCKVRIYNLALF